MDTEKKIITAYAKLEASCTNFSVKEKEVVRQAFELANSSLIDVYRENGDPFIFHAISVAQIIVSEIGLRHTSAAAIFLHEASRINTLSKSDIQKAYGKEIYEIVSGLTKISNIDIKATSLQAENFRKLIVSLSNDPRVTIIKLADRLEVMRSLNFFSPLKQKKKSTETLLLYAPIAHQLGLYNLKSELEDLSLRYTEAETYRLISNKLKSTASDRNKLIKEFLKPIEIELKKRGFKYHVKSRTKSVYSIWTKMQKQKVAFEGVYDVFAIRIILDVPIEKEKEACWDVFSIVTSFYEQNTERTRDWVTVPKANGYESLHTTVDTPDGKTVEIQIRTERMDDIAEKGMAAHWRYKGIQQAQGIQQWLDNVRNLLESPAKNNEDNFLNFTQNEIFVFTPSGDLRRLPVGATVLDFAFDIHSGIGAKCVGAKINGKNVTIKETLKTGDSVEITTSKNQQPKPDWLSYVVTSKARTRIKAAIREEEVKVASIGKELLERRLKNWKLASLDEALGVLIKHYKLRTITELYSQIASEKININEVKEILTKTFSDDIVTETKVEEQAATPKKLKLDEEEAKGDYLIIDENLKNLNYKLAKCCNPIRGDDIFGFVTINDGIKIHRFSCPNASRLLERYDYRVLKAKWKETPNDTFQASLKIVGDDEFGLVRHITDVSASVGAALRNINISSARGAYEVKLQVMVSGTRQLDMLMHKLHTIKIISKVVRLTQ
ncbi:MAG: RelA/SpoT family protein [Prevotellaceae bacterium]|nr:RelA/SpoT family protein [Prevotellaceae bacterium]